MATSAQSIIRRVVDIAQDVASVRWTVQELVRWLNDGQREIAIQRPDLVAAPTVITLVSGTRQTLPATAFKLIDIVNNVSNKRAVRQIEREPLDEINPDWHNSTESAVISQYMYDIRTPREFYVYPPAQAGAALNTTCAIYPVDIAEPSSGSDYTAVSGNISIIDLVAAALVDYILYRAYAKDSEYAGNIERAAAHYTAFANLLGVELKATSIAAPGVKSPGQPAVGP